MKRKHLLLLTLLLSQSAPIWGMMGNTNPVEDLHSSIQKSVKRNK